MPRADRAGRGRGRAVRLRRRTAASACPPSLPWFRMSVSFRPLHRGSRLSCRAARAAPDGADAQAGSRHGADRAASHVAGRSARPTALRPRQESRFATPRRASIPAAGGRTRWWSARPASPAMPASPCSQGLPIAPRSFYVDLVRRAAEAGLAVDAQRPDPGCSHEIRHRWRAPPSRSADRPSRNARLSAFDDGCGLRFPGLALTGSRCCMPVDRRRTLACFIDRICHDPLGSRRKSA